jgi:hypothetical protein
MTKADAIAVMGKPVSFGADKQSEVMYYRLVEGDLGSDIRTYFVRLVDGKVESKTYVNSLPVPPPVQ